MLKALVVIFFISLASFCKSQITCKQCDSLLNRSQKEYSYHDYKRYSEDCLIKDSLNLIDSNIINKYGAGEYRKYTTKNICNTYLAISIYNIQSKATLFAYYVKNRVDTIYTFIPNIEKEVAHVATYIKNQLNTYKVTCGPEYMEGKVFTRFVVNKKSEIEDIFIFQGRNPIICEETVKALNYIKKFKKMKPFEYNGKPIKLAFNFPVSYKQEK